MLRFPQIAFIPLLFVAPLLAPFTHAWYDACEGPDPRLGIVQLTSGQADATFYLDDRNYLFGNGIYLFQETNGIWSGHAPGVYVGDSAHVDLQRGAHELTGPIVPTDIDFCVDDPSNVPDLMLD